MHHAYIHLLITFELLWAECRKDNDDNDEHEDNWNAPTLLQTNVQMKISFISFVHSQPRAMVSNRCISEFSAKICEWTGKLNGDWKWVEDKSVLGVRKRDPKIMKNWEFLGKLLNDTHQCTSIRLMTRYRNIWFIQLNLVTNASTQRCSQCVHHFSHNAVIVLDVEMRMKLKLKCLN